MAGELRITATPSADRAIRSLRGRVKARYEAFEHELRSNGCAAAGYRLLSGEPVIYSLYCCKRLWGSWRVVTTFEDAEVRIVAVGEHDGEAFYASLAELGIGPVGQRRASKPDCCGSDGWPSLDVAADER